MSDPTLAVVRGIIDAGRDIAEAAPAVLTASQNDRIRDIMRRAALLGAELDGKQGKWVTVRGTPVFIPNGRDQKDVISEKLREWDRKKDDGGDMPELSSDPARNRNKIFPLLDGGKSALRDAQSMGIGIDEDGFMTGRVDDFRNDNLGFVRKHFERDGDRWRLRADAKPEGKAEGFTVSIADADYGTRTDMSGPDVPAHLKNTVRRALEKYVRERDAAKIRKNLQSSGTVSMRVTRDEYEEKVAPIIADMLAERYSTYAVDRKERDLDRGYGHVTRRVTKKRPAAERRKMVSDALRELGLTGS